MIANGGYSGDDPVWMLLDTDLGSGYQRTIGPTKLGGELSPSVIRQNLSIGPLRTNYLPLAGLVLNS